MAGPGLGSGAQAQGVRGQGPEGQRPGAQAQGPVAGPGQAPRSPGLGAQAQAGILWISRCLWLGFSGFLAVCGWNYLEFVGIIWNYQELFGFGEK